MRKMQILMLFALIGLGFACSKASSTLEASQDLEPEFVSLLIEPSDIITYECEWMTISLPTVHASDDVQAKGADESANKILEGLCQNSKGNEYHITLRHELYLYVKKDPNETASFLVPLSEDAKWRDFDLRSTSKYENINKCASYDESEYQDCFFVTKYDSVVSVLWLNSSRDIPDEDLRVIASEIINSVEKRILNLVRN